MSSLTRETSATICALASCRKAWMLLAMPEIAFNAAVSEAIAELRLGAEDGSTASCVSAVIALEMRASSEELLSSEAIKSCARSK
jgi:hypothetical protein